MGLTRLAIARPVTMFILMVLAIMMGFMSWNGMRQELQPEVAFGVITVTTVYPGAGPDEINTLVSRVVEESLSGVPGLREVTSNSQEGISVVVGNFEIGTDMDEALNEARSKVDQIVPRLPRGAEKPTISKLDTSSSPVLRLVLGSKELNSQQLRDLADDKIKDRFARIPGVASVVVSGGDIREIKITVKRDKLVAYKLGIADVQRAIQSATLNVPSGRIVSGDQEYSVRVLGEFKSVEEIRQMSLSIQDRTRQNSKPVVVPLTAVAEVSDSVTERRSFARLNGADAVSISIRKARSGNAIQIEKQAEQVIESLEKDFKVSAVKTFNEAEQIAESLADLIFALVFGIILVTLIVYIFLHNLRGTIIVGIAIPVCLFATFIVLAGLGFTINNMSMLALSLAIGVLVDDAIVVLENIFRHLRQGEDPVSAAINGRSEIGLAAIAITLADVVVFLPIANMGGVVGQFFKPLGIGFAVCTLVSLFVSFTITPMLASRWYRKGEDVEHFETGFAGWFERRFTALQRRYGRALEWALQHRWFVFITGFAALIGIFVMIGGSFAGKMAPMMAMGMAIMGLQIGLIVFGLVVYGKKWGWKGVVPHLVAGFILQKVLGPVLPKEMNPLFISLALAAVPAFFVNMRSPVAKSRMVLSGLAFGAAIGAFAILGASYADWKKEPIFKFGFFPPSDSGQVQINVTLPPGSNLEATQRVVERIENVVLKHSDVEYVVSDVGEKGGGGGGFSTSDTGTNLGSIAVTLYNKLALMDKLMFWKKHGYARTKADTSVAADLLADIGKVAGAEVTVAAGANFGFGAPIQLSFRSDDRPTLLAAALKIKKGLDDGVIKGVISPEISSKPGKPEILALPDRTRLADMGITAADLANSMRVLYEGDDTTKFRVKGREYDIRVLMDLDDRNDPKTVAGVPITFVQGNPVYLDEVARIEPGIGVDKINRRDREEEVIISANLLPGLAAGNVQQQIDDWLKEEKLIPEGVTLKPLGQADVQNRETGYLMTALLLGLVLVYMLLASLYENLLYPFIIQLAQPQAMVGAILALVLTDKTLNIVGMVGIIALVGLVGKNAILVVDYTNTLRSRGKNRHDALVEAGPTRLRPILMTTLALILGMLPVALAIGRGSEFRETIGITIIGGITLSTMLTLFVIPCSYTIFDDFSNWISKTIQSMRRNPPVAEQN